MDGWMDAYKYSHIRPTCHPSHHRHPSPPNVSVNQPPIEKKLSQYRPLCDPQRFVPYMYDIYSSSILFYFIFKNEMEKPYSTCRTGAPVLSLSATTTRRPDHTRDLECYPLWAHRLDPFPRESKTNSFVHGSSLDTHSLKQ